MVDAQARACAIAVAIPLLFVVVLVGARLALDASGRAVHLEYVAVMLAIVAVFGLIAWRTTEPKR